MPGHKGTPFLGPETMDITEISGADDLFHPSGIIAESELNAGRLFGCHSFYSTEGSSLCIRAMLYLCTIYAQRIKKKPVIAAGRNAHKVLLSAAALLDFDLQWITAREQSSYLSSCITAADLGEFFATASPLPTAVYITSPDYLGHMSDVASLAEVCQQYQVLLVVDNAHGAYLKFMEHSMHPMDLGADLCCDSAHKTLPVLTGGAYLHISNQAPSFFVDHAKQALSLFASTSPSYLILDSLDLANRYLADQYSVLLDHFIKVAGKYKEQLSEHGYRFIGDEPLKWTLDCKAYGYRGEQVAAFMFTNNISVEFSDPDYVVLMLTPDLSEKDLKHLTTVLLSLKQLPAITEAPPALCHGICVLTPRQAALCISESIPIEEAEGRILADPSVGCPPAVPILVCGEQIDRSAIAAFQYYGVTHCRVCTK